MEIERKLFQGVSNIIRFNWHFYVLTACTLLLLLLLSFILDSSVQLYVYVLCLLIFSSVILSLLASFYVYDFSDLYQLNWIDKDNMNTVFINVHSGFDETSTLIAQNFPQAELHIYDFYNPVKHTEVSIKRARKAYPSLAGTTMISTDHIPLSDTYADKITVTLSAHEIRNEQERILFFTELFRVLKPSGKIYVTEHLRDLPNFLVYNIGFFHFHSKNTWHRTFKQSGLQIKQEIKTTPFISTFILTKHANTN
jgi:hypothetical protein